MKIILGDITTFTGDAIVNAANSSLLAGGGVDGAIRRKAGKKLDEVLSRTKRLEVTDCLTTFAFDLPCKLVVHTVAPRYAVQSIYEVFLAACYSAVLNEAWGLGCSSLAIPLLGTGAFGWPLKLGAEIAVNIIKDFELNNSLGITLYAYTQEAYEEARRALEVHESGDAVKSR